MNLSDAEEIRSGLATLEPDIPWTHHFDLGHGIETITKDNEKYYKKSIGLGKLGDLVSELVKHHTINRGLNGLRVLDVASAEGRHSISMAQQGASVVGIEGRELYVRRAQFAAKALGCENVSFLQDDVRSIDKEAAGQFDMVLCSGILHHLDRGSFRSFLSDLSSLTSDTLIIYTHISTPESVKQFGLQGPVRLPGGYEGHLFQEHKKNASKEERQRTVRASLDNTMSFWAKKDSLIRCLSDVGFSAIYDVLKPHIFSNPLNASFRPILIARK